MRILNSLAMVAAALSFSFGVQAQTPRPCAAIQLYPVKKILAVGEPFELIVTTGHSDFRIPPLPFVYPEGFRVYYEVNIAVDSGTPQRQLIAEPDVHLFYDLVTIKSFRVPLTFDSPGLKRITVKTPNGSPPFNKFFGNEPCSESLPATASTEILVEAKPVAAPLAVGYSGLWWNPKTSGQGVFITQNTPSNIAYIGWFTYDQTGVARWYVGDNCAVQNNSCVTTIYETKGATFDGANFNNANLKLDAVGTATVTFASNQAATMVYTLKTSGGKLDLVRQPF